MAELPISPTDSHDCLSQLDDTDVLYRKEEDDQRGTFDSQSAMIECVAQWGAEIEVVFQSILHRMPAKYASIIAGEDVKPAEREPGSSCLCGPRSDLKRSRGVGQPLGVAVVATRVCSSVPVLPQHPATKQPSVQPGESTQTHCRPCLLSMPACAAAGRVGHAQCCEGGNADADARASGRGVGSGSVVEKALGGAGIYTIFPRTGGLCGAVTGVECGPVVEGIQGSGGEGDLCHLIAQTVHVGQPVCQGQLVDAVMAAPALRGAAACHRSAGLRRLP